MRAEISFEDAENETINGYEYYQIDEGWITFKDAQHKVVIAYPEDRVTRIARLDPHDEAATIARRIGAVA